MFPHLAVSISSKAVSIFINGKHAPKSPKILAKKPDDPPYINYVKVDKWICLDELLISSSLMSAGEVKKLYDTYLNGMCIPHSF